MNALFAAGLELQCYFRERRWSYCLIGGLAVIRWGEVRATLVVDILLLTGFGSEETYARETLSHFRSRIPQAVEFALKNRVLLVKASNDVPVDISLGGISFEEEAIRRAKPFDFAPGVSLVTCSAEDLIVFKAFADRPQDWLDIDGVLIRQKNLLDWNYIHGQLAPLCALREAPEILKKLYDLREKMKNEPR